MPTVMRIGGYRVVIYLNDHRPAHVHVLGGDGSAVFPLNCYRKPVELRESQGLTRIEARRICLLLEDAVQALCSEWRRYHADI